MLTQKGIQWTFYTTGHSLGGFLATVTAIEIGQEIEKCAPCKIPYCLEPLAPLLHRRQGLCAILRAALSCFLGSLTMLMHHFPHELRDYKDVLTS